MICTYTECKTKAIVRGYCGLHYQTKRRNGSISPIQPPRVYGENRAKNPVYKAYYAMLARCNNSAHKYYSYYGGRGITVCSRWQGADGFTNFVADMGDRPFKHTLDRIDNSNGYSPENCSWATHREQGVNTRTPKTNSSGYKGVSQYPNGRWTAYIHVNQKKHHLGYFDTAEDAYEARQKAESAILSLSI